MRIIKKSIVFSTKKVNKVQIYSNKSSFCKKCIIYLWYFTLNIDKYKEK
jgi:hypothetical protein